MEILLHENIRALRKSKKMTQEQLAEAMGVTVGAVHKWESKASMPEIRLLIEMADLFGVSVDVLLGYEMKSSGVEDIIERIRAYLRTKDYDNAFSEAEKALTRYPNVFEIVSCCAWVYERRGVETGDRNILLRAIELMERSIPLLSQNKDSRISEITIRSDIATCHIMLGQTDKGLDILKKHNAGGINNALIGLICSMQENFDSEETENYLGRGMGEVLSGGIRCMSGYVNYYSRSGNYAAAMDAAQWLAGFLCSLKKSRGTVCYLDRVIAPFQAAAAAILMVSGRQQEGEALLGQAYRTAASFDRAPVYSTEGIRFCIGDITQSSLSDDLGETAMAAVEKVLRSDEQAFAALKIWERLKAGHREDNENE